MGYRYDICSGTTSGDGERRYAVGTPDLEGQVVLRQLGRARGLHTHVPDGEKNLVVVRGSEPRVRALIEEAQSLALRLYFRRFQTLISFLKEQGLEVPPLIEKTVAQLEAEGEAAWDQDITEEPPWKRD